MKLIRHTQLHFQQGKSDKIYEVDIVDSDNKYWVNFRYGKRGARLTESTKTKEPVDFEPAVKIADSLLVSKINKGYQVVQGYDPVTKQNIGTANAPGTTTPATPSSSTKTGIDDIELGQRLLNRIEKFAAGKRYINGSDTTKSINYIDGYSLSRTIWLAGELRVKGLAHSLAILLDNREWHLWDEANPGVTAYSMVWALGRCGDPEGLVLVKHLAQYLSENKQYLLQAVTSRLSSEAQASIKSTSRMPEFDTGNAIKQLNHALALKQMHLVSLDQAQQDYYWQVMADQGVEAEVREAIQQLQLDHADAIAANQLKALLPTHTLNIINANKPVNPQLKEAIQDLWKQACNQKVAQAAQQHYPSYAHIQQLIKTLDLNQVFNGDRYNIRVTQQGRFDWLWRKAKRSLKQAIKQAGSLNDEELGRLWRHLEHYARINEHHVTEVDPNQLTQSRELIQKAGMLEEVQVVLDKLDYQTHLNIVKHELSPTIRSKFEQNINQITQHLFEHKLSTIRQEALKQTAQQRHNLNQHLLQQYQSAIPGSTKAELINILHDIPVNSMFFPTLRQLYKIAEFHDDPTLLAFTNYQIELSTPPKNNYWDDQQTYSHNTKNYFRRRLIRTLKQVAKYRPQDYPNYAAQILIQADDNSSLAETDNHTGETANFPHLSALNFILHKNSACFRSSHDLVWYRTGTRNEAQHPEAYPALWQQEPQAPEALLEILLHCKAALVNDFAYRHLRNHEHFITTINNENWLKLVTKPFENTALLAVSYLSTQLGQQEVLRTVLQAQFPSVRSRALGQLNAQQFSQQPDLLLIMLVSPYEDVYDFAKQYIYTAQAHYSALAEQLTDTLLSADDTQQAYLLSRVEWLLLDPMQHSLSLEKIHQLLDQPKLSLQLLAVQLLENSNFSAEAVQDIRKLMMQSPHPEIWAGALALIMKLPLEQQKQQSDALFPALIDEHPDLRLKSAQVVSNIHDSSFQMQAFQFVLPTLFKAEPADGFANDMVRLLESLKLIHADIDIDVIWRLLNAKSKMADRCGAVLLPAHAPSRFSVKQLALLSKNPSISVRDWALDAMAQAKERINAHFPEAASILDNRWDDSRERAIALFRSYEEAFWTTERIIAVCDHVYDDVQQLGRELVTRCFQKDQGEMYLTRLSQHPSSNVQLFVSGFLQEYGHDRPEIILSLTPYFRTVLSQINQGRIIKDRIVAFLFEESPKDPQVAHMVAKLLSDQSISRVIKDRSHYIQALFDIQKQFNDIPTPLQTVALEVRAV